MNKSSRSSCRRHSGPSSCGSNTRTLPKADTESHAAPMTWAAVHGAFSVEAPYYFAVVCTLQILSLKPSLDIQLPCTVLCRASYRKFQVTLGRAANSDPLLGYLLSCGMSCRCSVTRLDRRLLNAAAGLQKREKLRLIARRENRSYLWW